MRVLHLTTHINTGGITQYIFSLSSAMKHHVNQIYVLSSGGEYEKRFLDENIILVPFDIKTKSELSPKVFCGVLPLMKFVKENKIDILHAHTRVTQVLARVVSKMMHIPCVTTCHGFYKRRLGRRLFPAWGSRVIAISDSVAEDLKINFKVPESSITTVYNGINIQKLESRAKKVDVLCVKDKWQVSDCWPIIGIVSRIAEDKGFEFLVRSIAMLKERYPNIKLIIAGVGSYEDKLRELIKELQIEDYVLFLGVCENIAEVYKVMDIFCLPSVWREGFGLVVAEAMAMRKSIVVSNTGALNTLIQDGENGFLVPPKDARSISEKITLLVEDSELRKTVADNAYLYVWKNFTIEEMSRRILNVYNQLLDR